jgi:hypothetical protein
LLVRDEIEADGPVGDAVRAEIAEIVEREKTAEFYALGVVLGYCYQGSPVVLDDGTGATWERSRDYHPTAIPGCLAPHRWLGDTSLYDLFGEGFTLLSLADGHREDIARARDEAAASATPLKVVELREPELRELYEQPLILIRPDQHVAWRGSRWPTGGVFYAVTGRASAQVEQAA